MAVQCRGLRAVAAGVAQLVLTTDAVYTASLFPVPTCWLSLQGETLQGRYSCGCEVCAEQISHHPPISCWQIRDHAGRVRQQEHMGPGEGGEAAAAGS